MASDEIAGFSEPPRVYSCDDVLGRSAPVPAQGGGAASMGGGFGGCLRWLWPMAVASMMACGFCMWGSALAGLPVTGGRPEVRAFGTGSSTTTRATQQARHCVRRWAAFLPMSWGLSYGEWDRA